MNDIGLRNVFPFSFSRLAYFVGLVWFCITENKSALLEVIDVLLDNANHIEKGGNLFCIKNEVGLIADSRDRI